MTLAIHLAWCITPGNWKWIHSGWRSPRKMMESSNNSVIPWLLSSNWVFANSIISAQHGAIRASTERSVDAGLNLSRSIICQCPWNRLTMSISGPVDTPINDLSNAAPTTSSLTWWRHAMCWRSFPNFCSIREQTPDRGPVFEAVVSKHKAANWSVMPHSSKLCTTASAWASYVPLDSFGTPRSCTTPAPEMRTGSLLTCSLPLRSAISFPSQ